MKAKPVNLHKCPLCHQGQLSQLTLMEVWGCHFCRHLFEWSADWQTLKVLDLSPTIIWSWNGRFWQRNRMPVPPLTPSLIGAAIALAVAPSLLLGAVSYIFPPLPGSSLGWLPLAWQGLALISHSTCIGWLMAESYQFSPYLWIKIKIQQWLQA